MGRIKEIVRFEDYRDSVSLWRFVSTILICAIIFCLGASFIYLRFKVRDLKIAINSTEKRIEKLRERETAMEASLQSRVHEWSLKQTASQKLGMTDFQPQRTKHHSFPDRLEARYASAIIMHGATESTDESMELLDRLIVTLSEQDPIQDLMDKMPEEMKLNPNGSNDGETAEQ